MTTTELIKILQDNEKGGISHKSRDISLVINGRYMPNPQISLSGTGDGVCGPEIDLDIEGDWLEQQRNITNEEMYQQVIHLEAENERLHDALESQPQFYPPCIDCNTKMDEVRRAYDNLSKQRWIPVSERLPEEDGEYLLFGKITDEDKNCIIIGEYDAWMEKFGIWQERLDIGTRDLSQDFYEYESVIAWMPLPEPYKESENE